MKYLPLIAILRGITTDKVLDSMNVKNQERLINKIKKFNSFDHNKELAPLEILFKKVENDN